MKTTEELTASELQTLASISRKEWGWRVSLAGFMLAVSCFLALAMILVFTYDTYFRGVNCDHFFRQRSITPFWVAIGVCALLFEHTRLCCLIQKIKKNSETGIR